MKNRFMKKTLAMTLAGAMAFSVAGCGSSDTSSTSSTTTTTTSNATTESSTETSTASAETEKTAEEVSINVMVWDRGNAAPNTTTEDNALTKWIQEQMKELYNINVTYTSVPRSGSDDKLNIMMSGGTAPDIVFTYNQNIFANYATSGALTELTDVYAQYGQDIDSYCGDAQNMGLVGTERYAVMKQRGTESPRHVAYIRQDFLDELGMDMPTTKEELEEYLYAVKDKGLASIPWAMSGRTDTEKMYLNFIGSYVTLDDDKEAYVYSEAYMAVNEDAKEGLRKLNQFYNDGIIKQEFATDTAEDVYMADVANGDVAFILDDATHAWDSFEVLNNTLGTETFVPVQCFDLPDGSYRMPYEQRYGMFVMIPSTTSSEKVEACMKYLNWLANPDNAMQVRYTPDYTTDEFGAAVEPDQDTKDSVGYPGTCDDLCIMNLNFSWVNDKEVLAQSDYANQASEWASLDWYKNYYEVIETGKFRYPVYSEISEEEQTYGADVQTSMIEFVYRVIACPADEFDATYDAEYQELVNAGLQKILDARAAYYDSVN